MDTSIIEELHQIGEVRQAGCVLTIDGDRYVMMNGRNVFDRHSLDIEYTSASRLEAHWLGFCDTHRAVIA